MCRKQKEILKILQSEFPIVEDPYEAVAGRLGMDGKQLLEKVKKLKKDKTIRRIGAVASAKMLGYKSTLIAADIDVSSLDSVVRFVNSFNNVTHNYLRDAEYNLWFTFSARTKKQINDFVRSLKNKKGVRAVMLLPATKTFKIKAEFEL